MGSEAIGHRRPLSLCCGWLCCSSRWTSNGTNTDNITGMLSREERNVAYVTDPHLHSINLHSYARLFIPLKGRMAKRSANMGINKTHRDTHTFSTSLTNTQTHTLALSLTRTHTSHMWGRASSLCG